MTPNQKQSYLENALMYILVVVDKFMQLSLKIYCINQEYSQKIMYCLFF